MKLRIVRTAFAAIILLASASALAQQPEQQASRGEIDALARDVERVESLRAVKDLQRFYAQYAQFGLWNEMADLFAPDAVLTWGDETVEGRAAIGDWLRQRVGGTRGLAPGALNTEFIEDPLVNLSVDGRSAEGRWIGLTMAGDGRGDTSIEGGIYENEFVLEDGVWMISRLHFFPQYEGDYANGWTNAGGGQLPQIEYHFTVDETGIPIPPPAGAAPTSGVTLTELETRIGALNAEDQVRNLQNAFGYYVDRKMWDDVVDLFMADGAVEIAEAGRFDGAEGVRQAMERMGGQGLQQGEFNDHPVFDTIVTVLPGNREAFARGIMLGMTGDSSAGEAGWSFIVFRNRFALDEGLWKLREMRLYPLLQADYSDGWGSGGRAHLERTLPAFTEPHPVTGESVTIDGFILAGSEMLTGALEAGASESDAASASSETARLLDARRRLERSHAYDGVVNVSSAYGYYLDDFQWVALSSIFAQEGNKHSPFAGYYLGRDRIKAAATTMYGDPPPLRDGIAFHWRFQPVIHVSHDGRSANLRTRLLQPQTTLPPEPGEQTRLAPGFNTGMYPNDQAVLEDGIWRLWSLTIDEHYVTSHWDTGWHGVEPTPSGQAAGQSPLVERLPPDILMTELGRRAEHFRGGTGTTLAWPDILPMWFHYKNPVTGRVPAHYWPDSVPGLMLPEARLIAHGYHMPPNGPDRDGIHIEITPPEANLMQDAP